MKLNGGIRIGVWFISIQYLEIFTVTTNLLVNRFIYMATSFEPKLGHINKTIYKQVGWDCERFTDIVFGTRTGKYHIKLIGVSGCETSFSQARQNVEHKFQVAMEESACTCR